MLNVNPQQLRCLYIEKHLSLRFIGSILGCSGAGIRYWLIKYDIPRRERVKISEDGRYIHEGYVMVKLLPDNPFYAMASKVTGGHYGYILEHRLIMAQHLDRCLFPWEIVHHKNHIRHHNRFENLRLFTTEKHDQLGLMGNRIKWLEQRVTQLEAELTILRAQQPSVNNSMGG